MTGLSILCIVFVLCFQGSSSQDSTPSWSEILEHTGGLSGNVGGLHTWPSGSNLGGYLHGDLRNPNIIDGGGIRGRYQTDRFNFGGDANVRFPYGRRPSYGVEAYGGVDFGRDRSWNLGGRGFARGQFGSRPSDYGFGVTLTKKFGRRRRSISCISQCSKVCGQSTRCKRRCLSHACAI
ncbi:unnamed protein product [Mytilus coruscus]|uniref:Uncharacterized protein n=1 Tax=Mytilus coruscus TaxID=42192 RepID=A0A6J8E5V9_MYTCO|nr:unnamed protein product [Mytilus coruscus]